MKKKFLILLFIFNAAFATSCSNNDAQNDFEAEAYTTPSNITETDFQGDIVRNDTDDWRISPLYSGLADVDPVFPNPVNWGSVVDLYIDVNGAISSFMELYYFNDFNTTTPVFLASVPITSDFELINFSIDTEQFGGSAERARGIHRLLIFDSNQRMVTYGDLLIE